MQRQAWIPALVTSQKRRMNPGMQSDIGCLECVCMSSCRASQVDKNIAWILGVDLLNSVLYFLMPCLPDCFRIGFWGMKKSGVLSSCASHLKDHFPSLWYARGSSTTHRITHWTLRLVLLAGSHCRRSISHRPRKAQPPRSGRSR